MPMPDPPSESEPVSNNEAILAGYGKSLAEVEPPKPKQHRESTGRGREYVCLDGVTLVPVARYRPESEPVIEPDVISISELREEIAHETGQVKAALLQVLAELRMAQRRKRAL
jgi:hypothetical protein